MAQLLGATKRNLEHAPFASMPPELVELWIRTNVRIHPFLSFHASAERSEAGMHNTFEAHPADQADMGSKTK